MATVAVPAVVAAMLPLRAVVQCRKDLLAVWSRDRKKKKRSRDDWLHTRGRAIGAANAITSIQATAWNVNNRGSPHNNLLLLVIARHVFYIFVSDVRQAWCHLVSWEIERKVLKF